MKRECGGCTACCKTHEISELQKPSGMWCGSCHIGRGCRIYDNRPYSCSVYECAWLRGYGLDSDRPQESRVVMDLQNFQAVEIGSVILSEVTPGASDKHRTREIIDMALEQGLVVVKILADRKGRQVIFPKQMQNGKRSHFVDAFSNWISSQAPSG